MSQSLPLDANTIVTRSLTHSDNERQLNVNDFWTCILGNLTWGWLQTCVNEVLADVAGQSVSNHLRHWACRRTVLWRVYGDTGMTEMNRVMGADGDPGVMEMNGAMASIYSGDPEVDSISSCTIYHLIIQRISHSILPIFRSHLLNPRFRGSSRPANIIWSHPFPMLLEAEPLILTISVSNAMSGAAECLWWTVCLRAPPSHHKPSLKVDLRSESWVWNGRRLPPGNMGKYGEKQLLDGANNVRLECRMM